MVNILSGAESEIKNPERLKEGVFRVLIAEDEVGIRQLFEENLTGIKGLDVFFVDKGKDALDILRRENNLGKPPFDLVITDWNLADDKIDKMDGFVVAEIVKNEFLAKRTVMLSGSADDLNSTYKEDELKKKGIEKIVPKTQAFSLIKLVKEQVGNSFQIPQK